MSHWHPLCIGSPPNQHRLHHALIGFGLIAAGLLLVLSDLKDRHLWLREFIRYG